MTIVLFRNVRSKKRKAAILDLDSITRKQLEDVLDNQVKPNILKAHERVVSNWKNKPSFQSKKFINPNRIAINIFPTGPNADIWRFVDEGTKPHIIQAKNAPMLKFRLGYQSKTLAKPARTVSGGGKATGPFMQKFRVNHPGNEARNFTGEIAEDIKPSYKDLIEKTFRKVAKSVEE